MTAQPSPPAEPPEDALARAARLRPDAPFVDAGDVTVRYGEAHAAATSRAAGFEEAGIGPGDVVGLWARNDVDTILALLALPRVGVTVHLLNVRLAAPELVAQLDATRASVIVGRDVPDVGRPVVPPMVAAAPAVRHACRPERPPGSAAVIVFTSGTGGSARGVVLSDANLEASAAASAAHLSHTADDRWLLVLPVFHVGGASVVWRTVRQGSALELHERFEPAHAAAGLHRATLASLVGSMLPPILAADPGPYEGTRAVLVGGGPTPTQVLEAAHHAGLAVLSTYGMTETASQIATAPLGDAPRRRVVPLPGAEVRVTEAGEIEVRGPMVSDRYVGQPASPAGTWLPTGDLGEWDGEFLQVIGRRSDLIVSGGENVHPREVERALEDLTDDVAVFGVPDPTWGEAVAAVYVGGVDADSLRQRLRGRLAGYKIPKRLVRVESIPRDPLGKVRRGDLARLVTDGDRRGQ